MSSNYHPGVPTSSAWQSMYGAMTPAQVQAQHAGGAYMPPAGAVPGDTRTPTSAQGAPTTTPQQASQAEAASPGYHTGTNANMGYGAPGMGAQPAVQGWNPGQGFTGFPGGGAGASGPTTPPPKTYTPLGLAPNVNQQPSYLPQMQAAMEQAPQEAPPAPPPESPWGTAAVQQVQHTQVPAWQQALPPSRQTPEALAAIQAAMAGEPRNIAVGDATPKMGIGPDQWAQNHAYTDQLMQYMDQIGAKDLSADGGFNRLGWTNRLSELYPQPREKQGPGAGAPVGGMGGPVQSPPQPQPEPQQNPMYQALQQLLGQQGMQQQGGGSNAAGGPADVQAASGNLQPQSQQQAGGSPDIVSREPVVRHPVTGHTQGVRAGQETGGPLAATAAGEYTDGQQFQGPGGNWTYSSTIDPAADPGTGQPGAFNEAGYVNLEGNYKAWTDVSWKDNQNLGRNPFIGSPGNWTQGFWSNGLDLGSNKVKNLHPLKAPIDDWDATRGTIQYTSNQDGFQMVGNDFTAYGRDRDSVQQLAGVFTDLLSDIYNLTNMGGSNRSAAQNAQLERKMGKAQKTAMALAQYGALVEYPTISGFTAYDPAGDPWSGHLHATEEPPPVVDDPTTPPPDPGGDDPGGGLVGGTLPTPVVGGTQNPLQVYFGIDNLSQGAPGFLNQVFGDFKKLSSEAQAAYIEMMGQMMQQEQGQRRQQGAVNTFADAINAFQNDSMRGDIRQGAQNIYDNPLPYDAQILRNQAVSDQHGSVEQGTHAISGAASRRGLGQGAVAGMQANLERESVQDLSRRLGDIDIRAAMDRRGGELQGLAALEGAMSATTGADTSLYQQLANMIYGAPQAATNPVQGLLGQNLDLGSYFAMLQAQHDAKHGGNDINWQAEGLGLLNSYIQGGGGTPTNTNAQG